MTQRGKATGGATSRKNFEAEARTDWEKPLLEKLTDVYAEFGNLRRDPAKNLVNGLRKAVTLFARLAHDLTHQAPKSESKPQKTREDIGEEVKKDLGKSYNHLLTDVYVEFVNPEVDPGTNRTTLENLVHGIKRASALNTKVGIDSGRTQTLILFLTIGVLVLAIDCIPSLARSIVAAFFVLLSVAFRLWWCIKPRLCTKEG